MMSALQANFSTDHVAAWYSSPLTAHWLESWPTLVSHCVVHPKFIRSIILQALLFLYFLVFLAPVSRSFPSLWNQGGWHIKLGKGLNTTCPSWDASSPTFYGVSFRSTGAMEVSRNFKGDVDPRPKVGLCIIPPRRPRPQTPSSLNKKRKTVFVIFVMCGSLGAIYQAGWSGCVLWDWCLCHFLGEGWRQTQCEFSTFTYYKTSGNFSPHHMYNYSTSCWFQWWTI